MADADWVKYRQIRGKPLPETVGVLGARYRLGAHLKRDFYAATGLYTREDGAEGGGADADANPVALPPREVLLKVYHTEPLWGLPLGWMGRFLCRREVGFLRQLDGIEGVPRVFEGHGPSGFVREFVPGCNLREFSRTRQVDGAFFPRLRAILAAVHARGVAHNDLSKPENVLVTADGAPVLIDFQIATRAARRGGPVVRAVSRRVLRYMQGVDHYHLNKQNSRRRPMDFTPVQRAALERKGAVITAHGWVRRPYRAVRHMVLRRLLTAAPAPGVPAPHVLDRAPARGRVGVAEDRPSG